MRLLLCILSVLLLVQQGISSLPRFDSIISFGDTFTDTGNGRVVYALNDLPDPTARPPYGQTFFGKPMGRSTDGRLIIDFIAHKLWLPLIPPSMSENASFSHGLSFAVSAATALDVSFFKDLPVAGMLALDTTLSMQLQWFESFKTELCSPLKECPPGVLDATLFFMGEFGVNDYSFAILGMTLPQVRSIVPDVVKTIADATQGLIDHGAKTVVVPGIPPLGCTPTNLVFFPSADPAGYEPRTGCLKDLNDLAVHHNTLLQEALETLQTNNPCALVVYADFYNPVIKMVKSPRKYGLTTKVLDCCCGGGGKYNFNLSAGCGTPGATVCDHPSEYLYWDGHFTEAAYRKIATHWMRTLNMQYMLIKEPAANRYFDIIATKDSAKTSLATY